MWRKRFCAFRIPDSGFRKLKTTVAQLSQAKQRSQYVYHVEIISNTCANQLSLVDNKTMHKAYCNAYMPICLYAYVPMCLFLFLSFCPVYPSAGGLCRKPMEGFGGKKKKIGLRRGISSEGPSNARRAHYHYYISVISQIIRVDRWIQSQQTMFLGLYLSCIAFDLFFK